MTKRQSSTYNDTISRSIRFDDQMILSPQNTSLFLEDSSRVLSLSGCTRNCAYSEYDLALQHDLTIQEDYFIIDNCSAVIITEKVLPVVEETELWAYGALDLVVDLGGYSGLLLGVSVLSVVDWAFDRVKESG